MEWKVNRFDYNEDFCGEVLKTPKGATVNILELERQEKIYSFDPEKYDSTVGKLMVLR